LGWWGSGELLICPAQPFFFFFWREREKEMKGKRVLGGVLKGNACGGLGVAGWVGGGLKITLISTYCA
jgi:hypothetical protein